MAVLLVLLLLLMHPLGIDADLQARFQLAQVPGVSFVVSDGAPLPAETFRPVPGDDVNWSSGPDHVVPLETSTTGARIVLQTSGGRPLLLIRDHTVVIAMQTEGPIRRWMYFNYLLYRTACEAGNLPPVRYADWTASPVPGARTRLVVIGVGVALWIVFLGAYKMARRRGRADPEAARRFFAAVESTTQSDTGPSWNQAGFARPLAGLLTLLATMTFAVGIYFVIQWYLSNRVQPFPEADGLWRTTYDTLLVMAALLDMGSGVAGVKYFAEDRVAHPDRALADFQFYIWWSFGQRLVQATILAGVAAWLLPASQYAIYAPFVLLFGFNGLPAIFQAGKNLCSALQRYDYQNLLDLLEQRVFFFLVPIPCILLGRAWGVTHPIYGEACGAALGLGLGTLASNLLVLGAGLGVVHSLGIPLRPLFLAQFDKSTASRMLWFGGKITLGGEPTFLLKSVESVIIVKMMNDFPAWLGIHQLLSGRMLQLYFFTTMFFVGSVSAISEAYSAHKRQLTQYYVARYLQFGMFIMTLTFSFMIAVAPAFVHSLGPQWDRAQPFLLITLLQGLAYPPAWISDELQQGAGRPGLFLITMGVEQGSRLLLFFVLVPRYQFAGIFMATGLALIVKATFSLTVNHLTIVPLKIAPWETLGAPTLVAVANFLLWKGVIALWVPATASEVVVLTLLGVASAVSIFLGFFLYGLCGGLDRYAVDELKQATAMCTFVRPLCQAISACALLGARLAPLRLRGLALAEGAWAEAADLDRTAHAALQGDR